MTPLTLFRFVALRLYSIVKSTDRIVEVVKCRMKFEVWRWVLFILISYSIREYPWLSYVVRAEGKEDFLFLKEKKLPPAPVIVVIRIRKTARLLLVIKIRFAEKVVTHDIFYPNFNSISASSWLTFKPDYLPLYIKFVCWSSNNAAPGFAEVNS